MSARYAPILKTMFLTSFYASIIPIGIVISCVGLIFSYWVAKVFIIILITSITSFGEEQLSFL
jgi:hypothetical protein